MLYQLELKDRILSYGPQSRRMVPFEANLLERIMAEGSLSCHQSGYTERSFKQLIYNIRSIIMDLTMSDNVLINTSEKTYRFINIQEPVSFGRLCLDFTRKHATLDGNIALAHKESLVLWEMMKKPGHSFYPQDIVDCISNEDSVKSRQDGNCMISFFSRLRRKIERDSLNPVYIRGDAEYGYRIGPHSEEYYPAKLQSFRDPGRYIGYNPETGEIRYPKRSDMPEEPMEDRLKGQSADVLRLLYDMQRVTAEEIRNCILPEVVNANEGNVIRKLRVELEPGLGHGASDYIGSVRGRSGEGYFLA